jgi:hypothetical protein
LLQTNNSGWFGDFAPLTGSEDQPHEPATIPAAPESPPFDQGSTEHVEPVAMVTSDSVGSYSEPDQSVPAGSGWDWIAEPDGEELSAGQVVATEATAVDGPLSSPAFSMDYAVTATGPAAGKPPHHRRSLRGYVIAGAMLAVVLVIGAGAALALSGGEDNTPTPQWTPAESIAPPPASANTAPDPATCPSRTVDTVTTGRDAGGTSSGPDVIKAFEYAYYVERDGHKARSYASELARMGSAESMQTYIDTALVPGTVHCVTITDRGPGLWALDLTETPPAGSEPVVIKQVVQTAQIDGRFYIVAITKDTAP